MRKPRVHISYTDWDDYALSTLSGRTVACMTDNPNFTDPRPSLEDYTVLVNDYRTKHGVQSNGGSRFDKEARDNARNLVLEAMKQLAFYVNMVAKGDAEILASSGFELVAEPQSMIYPRIVNNLRMGDGRFSSEISFKMSALREADEYEYTYATELDDAGQPVWGDIDRTSNSRMNYISGLPVGKACYLRVRARNKKGIGDWSVVASIIVR